MRVYQLIWKRSCHIVRFKPAGCGPAEFAEAQKRVELDELSVPCYLSRKVTWRKCADDEG